MQQDLEKISFHNVHCRNLNIAQLLKQHVVSNRKNKIRIFFFFVLMLKINLLAKQ